MPANEHNVHPNIIAEVENLRNMLRNFQERGICPGTNNEPTDEDLLS